jgi:hypothetical protein
MDIDYNHGTKCGSKIIAKKSKNGMSTWSYQWQKDLYKIHIIPILCNKLMRFPSLSLSLRFSLNEFNDIPLVFQ